MLFVSDLQICDVRVGRARPGTTSIVKGADATAPSPLALQSRNGGFYTREKSDRRVTHGQT